MRDDIKAIATELLITNGIRGLRFGDIADQLGITRGNVHYYFPKKQQLVEEIVEGYVEAALAELDTIWSNDTISYDEKARRTMEFNKARYKKFNPDEKSGKPWSLVTRMRIERDLLGGRGNAALVRFSETIERYINQAVLRAQHKGEIASDAPVRDVAVQLISVVDSAGSITQDSGSFDRLHDLYMAYVRVISHAYGGQEAHRGGHESWPGRGARARA